MPYNGDLFHGSLAKAVLNAIVHRKIDRPRREVAKDGRPKTAIEATETVVLEDVLDCVWIEDGGLNRRTLSRWFVGRPSQQNPSPATPS
jgi:hypothetical protein